MGESEQSTKELIRDAAIEAVGWAYADCIATLDRDEDPRKTDMAGVVVRAIKDLKLEEFDKDTIV